MTTFSDAAWDGSASNYQDTDAYCAACMIDTNPSGAKKVQANCKLPYKTPSGAVSKAALRSIAGVLQGGMGGVKGVSPAAKKAAAKKCLALMHEAKIDAGQGLKDMAS